MKRIALTHPEKGVYLGQAMGLGFFSLLDCVGQSSAYVFANEETARRLIGRLDVDCDPNAYRLYPVETREEYADVVTLLHAGIPQAMLEPMIEAEIVHARVKRMRGARFQ